MIRNLFAFAIAAVLEIAGCYAFWRWLREGRPPVVALAGIASLIGFAVMLTQVDCAGKSLIPRTRAYESVSGRPDELPFHIDELEAPPGFQPGIGVLLTGRECLSC